MIIIATYKDLNSLFKAVQKDMHETMATDVFDTVVDVQQEEIHSEVYNAYEPFQYDRRGDNGGLSDRDNNAATFFTVNGGMQMLVQNVTKGQDENMYIAPLVAYGDSAGYGEYMYKQNRDNTQNKYLRPRNFILSTMRRLERSLEHVDSMKRGLAKKGYKFYK